MSVRAEARRAVPIRAERHRPLDLQARVGQADMSGVAQDCVSTAPWALTRREYAKGMRYMTVRDRWWWGMLEGAWR